MLSHFSAGGALDVREQQVRALYRAALERPPAERAAFVADLTGDDVELRKSVELLLSAEHDATAAGERAAAAAPAAELATSASSADGTGPPPTLTVIVNWAAGLNPP